MSGIPHNEMITLLVAVGLLIGLARIFGELFAWLRQPPIIGEFCAGIVLGPTVLGALSPAAHAALFPATGAFPIALEALTKTSVILFLLVAGLEVDLSIIKRERKAVLSVSILGMMLPFGLGFLSAWYIPAIAANAGTANPVAFSMFFATALAISALPVIAKILMDLGIFRSDVGMVVIAAAIVNDLAGWIIFGVILGAIGAGSHANPIVTVAGLLAFAAAIIFIGRPLFNRIIPWLHAHASWPGGILGFTLSMAFLFAAGAEWLGAHGIFGAFLFGVALGDSPHLRSHTRHTLEQFIGFIFAPLFFASVGIRVNFVANFDLMLVVTVLFLGTVGKLAGCWLGARLSGMGRRESWAIGVALNARGAMEIILGLLALHAGLIGERMFVALVVMALFTSMTSAALLRRIMGVKTPVRFFDFLNPKAFVAELQAADQREAVQELARHVAASAGLDPQEVAEKVWQREQVMTTGLGQGVAVPHARLDGLKAPLVGVGLSHRGIDFNSSDGKPSHFLCLLLIPQENPDIELSILSDVARFFQHPEMLERVLPARSHTEFIGILKTAEVA